MRFPSWPYEHLIIRIIADSDSRTTDMALFDYPPTSTTIERIYVSSDQRRAYTTGSSTDSASSVKSLEL